jgi:hypothetical protein
MYAMSLVLSNHVHMASGGNNNMNVFKQYQIDLAMSKQNQSHNSSNHLNNWLSCSYKNGRGSIIPVLGIISINGIIGLL